MEYTKFKQETRNAFLNIIIEKMHLYMSYGSKKG